MSQSARKQLHILYLIDELIIKGGTESHLLELVRGMTSEGHRVSVICLAEGEFARSFHNLPGVSYLCLKVDRIYDWNGLRALLRLAFYIRSQQVNVVQTFHTASDLIGPVAATFGCVGVRVISSRRDLGYTKSARHVRAQRIVNLFVDGILANSEAVKSVVVEREKFPSQKIDVIYNGIDAEYFANPVSATKQTLSERLCLPKDSFIVGSVGNLRPVKGYRHMVEAAALACPRYPNLRFLVAGEGEIDTELKKMCVDLGIEKQFTFLGKVKEIPEFLSCLDVYVQPSLSEGFSNAILEAMAAGVPVVATSVGGNQEVLDEGRTGLLVKPGDAEMLMQAVELLMAKPVRRRSISAEAKKRVAANFTFGRMLGCYAGYYGAMVEGKSHSEVTYGLQN